MKNQIKKPIGRLNYEEYLISLKNTVDRLELVKDLHDYFKPLKRKRNCFIVEMRRLVALDLKSKGYTLSEISRILSRDHASIFYILKTLPHVEVYEEVNQYYKQWIIDKVYPHAVVESQPSYFHPTGVKRVTTYTLKTL